MTIEGLDSLKPAESAIPPTKGNVMGKDDFLKLLVTQLNAQDPLNPLESAEFTAQLAQFSSLEQLYTLNEHMENLQRYQASLNNGQAVGLIGKTVKAPGNSIHLNNGNATDLHFELAAEADSVVINISRLNGDLVKTIDAGPLDEGEQSLNWETTDNDGKQMPDGVYTFEILAADANSEIVNAATFGTGTVTGVVFKNGTARLLVGNLEIPMSSVIQISQTEPELGDTSAEF